MLPLTKRRVPIMLCLKRRMRSEWPNRLPLVALTPLYQPLSHPLVSRSCRTILAHPLAAPSWLTLLSHALAAPSWLTLLSHAVYGKLLLVSPEP